jgi:riboflavin-specific deaminase-like protein
MVGIGTVLADDPLLTVRLVKGRNPLRICLDSHLRIPLNSQVLSDDGKTLIAIIDAHDIKKVEAIQRQGKEVLMVQEGANGRVELRSLMKVLAERGISSILVEGGTEVITALLKEGLANRMVVITAPLILGKGVEGIGDLGIIDVGRAIRPSSRKVKRIGEDIVFDLRF